MTVVATLCAVLTAIIPVIVGVALGQPASASSRTIGIVIAVPAIILASWQPGEKDTRVARSGPLYGVLAGLGFALLFIALDQAGTHAGPWPLLPGQLISLLVIAPFAYRAVSQIRRPRAPMDTERGIRTAMVETVAAGVLSGAANLLFLAATSGGLLGRCCRPDVSLSRRYRRTRPRRSLRTLVPTTSRRTAHGARRRHPRQHRIVRRGCCRDPRSRCLERIAICEASRYYSFS